MIIAIDFDGTIVSHDYPRIGDPNPLAIPTMLQLIDNGHKIILWTMRDGKELLQAVEYLNQNKIILWGINKNPHQDWSKSPKAYAQLYIDDAALGCPLMDDHKYNRPRADWSRIKNKLNHMNLI